MDSAEDRSRQLQDQAGRVRREKLEDIPYSRLVEIAKNLLLAKRMQSQVPEDIVFNTMLPMNYIRVNNLVHNEPGGAHHKCNKNKEIKTKVKGKASAYPDEVAHAHDQSPDPEPTDNMILETEDMGVLLIPGFLDRTDVENLRWDYQFKRLIDFKNKYGHCDVQYDHSQHHTLGIWVYKQRCLNKKKTLQADRFERLDRIGFTWVCRPGKTAETPRRSGLDELWETRLKELEEFKKINGHCNVPYRYPEKPQLGNWVIKQRSNWKNNNLSTERQARLTGLGFCWAG